MLCKGSSLWCCRLLSRRAYCTQVVLEPPREPSSEECCQSGCLNCVWNTYAAAMDAYNQHLSQKQPHTITSGQQQQAAIPTALSAFEAFERSLQQSQQLKDDKTSQ
ncbi:hypothetical protein V8C86DRAFT_2492918 [Haematococcus lacustris]